MGKTFEGLVMNFVSIREPEYLQTPQRIHLHRRRPYDFADDIGDGRFGIESGPAQFYRRPVAA